jgi:hypothetical protein
MIVKHIDSRASHRKFIVFWIACFIQVYFTLYVQNCQYADKEKAKFWPKNSPSPSAAHILMVTAIQIHRRIRPI